MKSKQNPRRARQYTCVIVADGYGARENLAEIGPIQQKESDRR
tara:strand:+ start:19582 stop:19710 length:129 start_codon:yes stop_codon:yes gene_type:complete